MKFSYKFSNLLGTVYRKGNLVFSADGNSLYSPVGNRITFYDLKSNKAQTLPFVSRFNYEAIDVSPNGLLLAAVNEEGEVQIISLVSKTVIFKYRFNKCAPCIRFSPDGKYLAALKDMSVFIFKVPAAFTGEFKGFEMVRVFERAHDSTTCIDWASDSRFLAVGSKDMTARVYSVELMPNFKSVCLGGHKDTLVGCFFEKDSLDVTSVSCDGTVSVWESSLDLDDVELETLPRKKKKGKKQNSDSESEDSFHGASFEMDRNGEDSNANEMGFKKDKEENEEEEEEEGDEGEEEDEGGVEGKKLVSRKMGRRKSKVLYKRISRQNLCSPQKKDDPHIRLTAASYHKDTHILVTGYSSGSFYLHELPSLTVIHSLSLCGNEINTITVNVSGDWIALGSSTLGNLLVWEWQSETYVLKQQGHANNMTCLSYSPDGMYLATGGYDGKVKLWNTTTGFCFVTFMDHSSNVTDVQFSQNRKFLVSSSLDGTVRAFDLARYRNFKTFTSPTPVQFGCVAVDTNGEFVAAGGQDVFEIFLWSLKIGRLCEVLTGHEGPVVGITFNPILGSTAMASVSWDKTLRLWNAVDESQENEIFLLGGDGLAVTFRPDGKEVAVSALDGQIYFFDVKDCIQRKFIEGRNDLGSGVSETDVITAKKNRSAKAFTSLCYSADGSCILAGGHSKNVCIYNVDEGMLLKKFEITENRSLDNVDEVINRRKMTEFGNTALVETREEGNVQIRLPGARKGDMSSRALKPDIRVFGLEFSPTGQAWAATTTEGLLIYSLDFTLIFDPLELSIDITPDTLRETIRQKDYAKAIMMAVKLGEKPLVQRVIECVPHSDVELCVASIARPYVVRCLRFIAELAETSKHFEFYQIWVRHMLTVHGSAVRGPALQPVLLSLQKSLTRSYDDLGKICNHNKYTMEFLLRIGRLKMEAKKMVVENEESDEDENLMGY